MIGSFLIFLREGVEGSMIVTIVLTYLAKSGRRDLFPWVFGGVAVALAGAALVAVAMYMIAKDAFIDSTGQTWFETGTFLVAVCILTYMTFWMKSHGRSLSSDMKSELGSALSVNSGMAVGLVAFVTVGREAIETAIFSIALVFHTSAASLLVGAVFGLAAGLALSFGMFRMGLRINMKRFFTVMGTGLLVVAAGLLADAIQNLQELSVIPGGGNAVWNTSQLLSDDSGVGDVLHGIVGYASAPSVLQVVVWALFLIIALWAFLRSGTSQRRPPQTA